MNAGRIPYGMTAGNQVSISNSLLLGMREMLDVPVLRWAGYRTGYSVQRRREPFLFSFHPSQGVNIITVLSEIIGITQYTDSTPNFCQNLSSFPARSFIQARNSVLFEVCVFLTLFTRVLNTCQ